VNRDAVSLATVERLFYSYFFVERSFEQNSQDEALLEDFRDALKI